MRRTTFVAAGVTSCLLGALVAGETSAVGPAGDHATQAGAVGEVLADVRVAASESEAGTLSNDEIVVATLDPSGLPERARLVSRLTSIGGPRRTVADPSSVTNVRYLDRLGRPQVSGEEVLLEVGGPGVHTVLTEARFDQPLPLALHAQYELGGRVVAPAQVVGSPAELTVRYTLTNTSLEQTKLTYQDAAGRTRTSTRPVFSPFTGTVLVTVPGNTEVVRAPRGVRTASADGATVVQWNVSLYPPLTAPTQEIELVTRAQAASLPGVTIRMAPAGNSADPAAKFAGTLLEGSAQGNEELLSGLRGLDDGAAAVADGASELADGVRSLASGAGQAAGAGGQLSTGLSGLASGAEQLAGGNQQLAGGLDQAASGARQLASGAAQLAAANTSAELSGISELRDATRRLSDGARTLAQRVGSPDDPELPDPLPAPDDDAKCSLLPDPPAPSSLPSSLPSNPPSSPPSSTPGGGTVGPGSENPAPGQPGADARSSAPRRPPQDYDDDCVTVYQALRALARGLHAAAAAATELQTQLVSARAAADQLGASITEIGTQASTAATGAATLAATLCTPPSLQLPPDQCQALAAVASAAGAAAQGAAGTATPLTSLHVALGTAAAYGQGLGQGLGQSAQAADALLAGLAAISAAIASGNGREPGLAEGLDALAGGLAQLQSGLQSGMTQLASALQGVSTGAAALATGVGGAADGARTLAAGAGQLASGGRQAADGSQQFAAGIASLANGAQQAAGGAADLARGARTLQDDGTAEIADSVLQGSTEPALARSWLAAAGKRAAHALPYGPPEGATGHVVYLLELPPQEAPARGLRGRLRDLLGW